MKKIYVWGTGVIAARILDYRIKIDDIFAFVDNNKNLNEYLGKKVVRPEQIEKDFDFIIVANLYSFEILKQCGQLGLDIKKIFFLYNNIETKDINNNYDLAAEYLGKEYSDIVKGRYNLVRNISKDEVVTRTDADVKNTPMYKDDYVRVKTLELVADEIKERNIEGAVAELGVFKGEFARCINMEFPDRKLYLFDTFEGFAEKEADTEKTNGSCGEAFVSAFKNVNLDAVINKMPYPDKIDIRQGFFPDTAKEINEKFAFVSLDVDFEDSTVKGLEYFYPRLLKGGYIFIHDYNYGYFDCIKKAVKRYENENNISLCKVPICDAVGTLIITK